MNFKYPTLLLCCIITTTTFGQSKIPVAVEVAFAQKFPTAQEVKANFEDDAFEYDFDLDGQEMSSLFANTGEWLETEWEIETGDLPDSIQAILKKSFAKFKIEEVERISMPTLEIGYELELKNGKTQIEILVDAQGKTLKREIENDKDDDDEQR